MFNIAVLTSGMSRGSNLEAMANYFHANQLPVRVSVVIITKKNAPVAEVCNRLNLPCFYIPYHLQHQFEEEVLLMIQQKGIQLVALAGFLKKLSPKFIRDASVPILNIHPALLPDFGGEGMYGVNVHEAVFNSGAKVSGASVHLVDSSYDHGNIIAQLTVDISDCKDKNDIATKVLSVEHQLYGKAIWEYLSKIYS